MIETASNTGGAHSDPVLFAVKMSKKAKRDQSPEENHGASISDMTNTEEQGSACASFSAETPIIHVQDYVTMMENVHRLGSKKNRGDVLTPAEEELYQLYEQWLYAKLENEMTPIPSDEVLARNAKLCAAATEGNWRTIQELIEAGTDVNAARPESEDDQCEAQSRLRGLAWGTINRPGAHMTALMCAVQYRHPECVRVLLRAGADVNHLNERRMSALMKAVCVKDNAKCMELLINARADVNLRFLKNDVSALTCSASGDHAEYIDALVAAGADVNDVGGDWSVTALKVAAALGFPQCVSRLIAAGAEVNGRPGALVCAAKSSDAACVRLLLQAGAYVVQGTPQLSNASEVHLACHGDGYNEETLMLLLAAGETVRSGAAFQNPRDLSWSVVRRSQPAVPRFLQELHQPSLRLMDLCRAAVRRHLLQLSPVNLLVRVPHLVVPWLERPVRLPLPLRKFLLYEMSLETETTLGGTPEVHSTSAETPEPSVAAQPVSGRGD